MAQTPPAGSIKLYRASGDTVEALPLQADSLDQASLQIGSGIYTVFRLYPQGRVLRFDFHFSRLRRSAELLGIHFILTEPWLRQVVRLAVAHSGIPMPRVRLTLPASDPESVVIALEPFQPPPATVYEEGVNAALARGSRQLPEAKDTAFIAARQALFSQHPGVYEVLLCDDQGFILEGLTSNFYAVLGGFLHTAGSGILYGTARSLLLEAAPSLLPVRLQPLNVSELPRLTEALLSSASRGVVPVVQIDAQTIGSGEPGPLSRQLMQAYQQRLEQELEPL
jgi:branched-chain amino acid aminotransferase